MSKSFIRIGKVTAEHLSKGIPLRTRTCPLAIAIKAILPKGWDVRVGPRLAYVITNSDRYFRASLGYDLADKVARVDYGLPVDPYEFSLDFQLGEQSWSTFSTRITQIPKQ